MCSYGSTELSSSTTPRFHSEEVKNYNNDSGNWRNHYLSGTVKLHMLEWAAIEGE